MTTYERPTDELRQVKRRIIRALMYTGPEGSVYNDAHETTVQRKWLVQDGTPVEKPYWHYLAEDETVWPLHTSTCTVQVPPGQLLKVICATNSASSTKSVIKLKEEWRDLPVVTLP